MTLYADDRGNCDLAWIETNFHYEDEIGDEVFLRFVSDLVAYLRTRPMIDRYKREGADVFAEEMAQIERNETDEERAFWDSLPTVVYEHYGLPHYLWLESLEFQIPED